MRRIVALALTAALAVASVISVEGAGFSTGFMRSNQTELCNPDMGDFVENHQFMRDESPSAEDIYRDSAWLREGDNQLASNGEGYIYAKFTPDRTGRHVFDETIPGSTVKPWFKEVICSDSAGDPVQKYEKAFYLQRGRTYYLTINTGTSNLSHIVHVCYQEGRALTVYGSISRRVLYREVDIFADAANAVDYVCLIPGVIWRATAEDGCYNYRRTGYGWSITGNGDRVGFQLNGMDKNMRIGTYTAQCVLIDGATKKQQIINLGTVEVKNVTELPFIERSGTVDAAVDSFGCGWFRLKTGKERKYFISNPYPTDKLFGVYTWDGNRLNIFGENSTGEFTFSPDTTYYIAVGPMDYGTRDINDTLKSMKITVEAEEASAAIPLSECTITISSAVDYTGKPTTPSIEVKYGEVTLKKENDYTVSLSNNVKLGNSAKVTLTGKGDYTGTVTKTYSIVLGVPKLGTAKSAGYNSINVTWNKVPGAKTYRLFYKGGSVEKWTLAKDSIAETSYTHKSDKLQTGTKYTYTVRAVNGSHVSGFQKKGVSAVPALAQVKISSVSSVSKGVKITWSKVDGADGYIIQRRDSGEWQTKKTIKKGSTVTFTDTTVNAGVNYSYRVCAYRTVNKKNVTGPNSAVRTLTAQKCEAVGIVTSSVTGKALSGVTLNFRKGHDVRTGQVYKSIKNAVDGNYKVELEAGKYTVELSKTGYITNYTNIECKNLSSGENRIDLSISPRLRSDQYRIVLSWGESPKDLDAHLTGPLSDKGRFHVFYHSSTAYDNGELAAKVDTDDRNSYGPETVTLCLEPDANGICRYYVHDYSNRNSLSSNALANSGARVTVYKGNRQVASYNVPKQAGTKWHVFNIRKGKVIGVNTLSYERSPGNFQ